VDPRSRFVPAPVTANIPVPAALGRSRVQAAVYHRRASAETRVLPAELGTYWNVLTPNRTGAPCESRIAFPELPQPSQSMDRGKDGASKLFGYGSRLLPFGRQRSSRGHRDC
jgi:hypothetical protein